MWCAGLCESSFGGQCPPRDAGRANRIRATLPKLFPKSNSRRKIKSIQDERDYIRPVYSLGRHRRHCAGRVATTQLSEQRVAALLHRMAVGLFALPDCEIHRRQAPSAHTGAEHHRGLPYGRNCHRRHALFHHSAHDGAIQQGAGHSLAMVTPNNPHQRPHKIHLDLD